MPDCISQGIPITRWVQARSLAHLTWQAIFFYYREANLFPFPTPPAKIRTWNDSYFTYLHKSLSEVDLQTTSTAWSIYQTCCTLLKKYIKVFPAFCISFLLAPPFPADFLKSVTAGPERPRAIALGMGREEVYVISSFSPGSSWDPSLLILTLPRHVLITLGVGHLEVTSWEGDLSKELYPAATEAPPRVSDHGFLQERER